MRARVSPCMRPCVCARAPECALILPVTMLSVAANMSEAPSPPPSYTQTHFLFLTSTAVGSPRPRLHALPNQPDVRLTLYHTCDHQVSVTPSGTPDTRALTATTLTIGTDIQSRRSEGWRPSSPHSLTAVTPRTPPSLSSSTATPMTIISIVSRR